MFVILIWIGIGLVLAALIMLVFYGVAAVLTAVVLGLTAFDCWQSKMRVRPIIQRFGSPARPPTPPFIDDNTTRSRDAP